MSDLHQFFKSEYDSPFDSGYIKPKEFRDKQRTKIGKASRDGELVNSEDCIIQCSNCKKDLCTIKITRPQAKIHSFVVAECPHCGDKSFKQEFFGSFCVGGSNSTNVIGYPMTTSSDKEYFIQNITIKTQKRGKINNYDE
jgi:hypothetical protein